MPATIFRATLSKAGLSAVPEPERILFFAIGHFANEVNAFQKQVLWSSRFDADSDAVAKAQVALTLIFLRTLAGKLKEGYGLLQRYYFGARLSREYHALLAADGKDALSQLKRYFGRANNIDVVRTGYAFHYSPAKLDAELAAAPDDLELFVSEDHGNSLYYASEVLANRAVLRAVGSDNAAHLFRQLVAEVLAVAKASIVFSGAFMAAFLTRHSNLWVGVAQPVQLPELRRLLDVNVPWYTDNAGVEQHPDAG